MNYLQNKLKAMISAGFWVLMYTTLDSQTSDWESNNVNETDNMSISHYFGKTVKIQMHLRTAGGSNYKPWAKLRNAETGAWSSAIALGTMQDAQWLYYTFSTAWQNVEVDAIMFDARDTNSGVVRYVSRFQITQWWQ